MRLQRLLPGLILLVLTAPLHAASEQLLVGLRIESHRVDLDFSGSARRTDFDALDIYWYERFNPTIEGGLKLGYVEATQSANPLAAGQAMSGEYLGIVMRFNLLQSTRINLFTDLEYRYSSVSRSLDNQDVEWDWHQGQAELGLALNLLPSLTITASAGALRISGRENASGTVNQVTHFDNVDVAYARVGLRLLLDPRSHVGIEGSTGSLEGGRLYFQRYF